MSVFIESLGFEVWQYVETGWLVPTRTNNGKSVIKPTSKSNYEEKRATSSNSIALYTIQYGMDDKMFELIASSEITKEAWDTL